jgi:nitrate reductase assembly molybdenum cofactor insertion protein NarJ
VIPARLFAYPGEEFEALAAAVPAFAAEVAGMSPGEREELYTRTFDWSPEASLEIGWHLYGENYQRGEFLVEVRGMLRRCGIAESEGLPDHLVHIVPLLERLPAEEAATFTERYVAPALAKIEAALAGAGNPYRHVVRALAREWGCEAAPAATLPVLEGEADE